MSFVKVSDLLANVAQRSGEPQAMEAAYVVEVCQREIGTRLGAKFIGYVRAISFRDGVLTLGIESSAWAQEVRLREWRYRKGVNEVLKGEVVVKVRYKVGVRE